LARLSRRRNQPCERHETGIVKVRRTDRRRMR
jgi:hypothetical protein